MNYYDLSIQELEAHFKTSATHGLASDRVKELQHHYGTNKTRQKKLPFIPTLILQQFMNPLVYLLLASAGIIFMSGAVSDGCIVLVIVLLNSIIGAIQEYRLNKIIGHLQTLQKRNYIVIRDGQKTVLSEGDIVPGDIVVLQDGQRIPADGRIVMGYDLLIDESILTGESRPVRKSADAKDGRATGGSVRMDMQHNMVFASTSLISGYAQILVVATGMNTESGKIQAYIPTIVTDLPLQKDLASLINFVLITIISVCVGLFILGLIDGKPLAELLAALLALFMCAVPQGLPVIMTLILAVGSYRLAKHNILAKRLHAVEALGRADVLVVDKTGTLTSNELMVTSIIAGDTTYSVSGLGYNPEGKITHDGAVIIGAQGGCTYKHMLNAALLLDRSQVTFNHEKKGYVVKGNPHEAALGVCARKSKITVEQLQERYQLMYEIPFHSDHLFHACFYKDRVTGKGIVYAAGALESLLKRGIKEQQFSNNDLDKVLEDGIRVIGAAYKELDASVFDVAPQDMDEKKHYYLDLFMHDVIIPGFFGAQDSLRKDVAATIEIIKNAGIRMIMATGDHTVTAQLIATASGLISDQDKVLDVAQNPDIDIDQAVRSYSVYARCLPADKLRIINVLQKQGLRVAMVGDGVNDVPALAMADLGVAMGITGSDSAKEAADIVLLGDSFASIPYAITEGRHIFYTFKRVLFYFLASNFTEVLVMVVAFVGYPLPLVASHVLWLNLVTDGFLDASLSLEQPDKNLLENSFKPYIKRLVSPQVIMHIFGLAIISAGITTSIFVMYFSWYGLAYARTMCMATLTVCQVINAVNSRSLHRSLFSLPLWGNRWLYGAVAAILLTLSALVYLPYLQKIFQTQSLHMHDWVVLLAVAGILFLVEEIRKVGMWLCRRI